MTIAKAGYNTLFKRGDGGVGAAVKASRTMGSSNAQIVIRAKTEGAAGNGLSCSIVISGNNTPLSLVLSGTGNSSSLQINSETDGGGLGVSTVNDILAAILQSASVNALFEGTDGSGDGTSNVVAQSLAFLTSGSDGAEVFTTVAEVTNVSAPGLSLDTVDATHMTSTGAWREYIATLKDGGEVSIDMNFAPEDTTHTNLIADLNNRTLRNFQIVWPNTAATTWRFSAFVTSFEPSAPVDDKVSASVGFKLSGVPVFV